MPSTDLVFSCPEDHLAWLTTQARLPAGFQVGSAPCSFIAAENGRPARMTITVISLDQPTPHFAACFTSNAFPGAPIVLGRERLDAARWGAVVINNKISNVATPHGVEDARRICAATAAALGLDDDAVLPSSTGIIGWRLPVEAMLEALPQALTARQGDSILPAATGIMTTDLYPKIRRADLPGGASIVAIAKGAGMIEPHLATMLVYLLTDAAIPRASLRRILPQAIATSFNAISIDSDQSTSDTVALLSSARLPCDEAAFTEALGRVCADLAEDVVRNGEGVRHVIRCTVSGAPTLAIAKDVAKAVINAPLVKTAIAGNDANVGRIIMAIGKELGVHHPQVPVDRCRITIADDLVFADGAFRINPALEARLHQTLVSAELYPAGPADAHGVFRPPLHHPPHERSVPLTIDLGCGDARFTAIGADLTHEYVSENADYRS